MPGPRRARRTVQKKEGPEDHVEALVDDVSEDLDVRVEHAVDPDAHSSDDSEAVGATKGTRTCGRGTARDTERKKRSYAEHLGSGTDDATLRTAYQALPGRRTADRARLLQTLEQQAPRWHLLLRAGFSLLLHGIGSKRHLLERVANQYLTDGAVVVCNGWVKGLTAYKVVIAAASALLGRNLRNHGTMEILELIKAEFASFPDRRVYIVLNSIDGPGLRSEAEQQVLAALAWCPNCHLLASCDHVNAALMWNSAAAANFRWFWAATNTYESMGAETLDMPSILLGAGRVSDSRNAGVVLRSMVSSARAALSLLVEAQREDSTLEGMDFKQLFSRCRQQFLYTSEAALRSALTEFMDHELLATRQSSEGGELLYVPLDSGGLDRLAEELRSLQAEAAAQ